MGFIFSLSANVVIACLHHFRSLFPVAFFTHMTGFGSSIKIYFVLFLKVIVVVTPVRRTGESMSTHGRLST